MPPGDLSSLKIHDDARSGAVMGKFWRIVAASLGVIVILAGLALALRRKAPVVEVAAARPAGAAQGQTLLNASGYVTPRRRATVAAKITGRVTGVFFDEGDSVKEGELLATLDDSDAKRALASAVAERDAARAAVPDFEVQLQYAEIELRRAQELHAGKIQSQEFLDAARTNVKSLEAKVALARRQEQAAQARVFQAQQAVENTVIRAPFAGIIVSKDAQVGEMVSPVSAGGGFTRTGIATIVDMNSNEIEVDVNEAYIARVHAGQRVAATLDAYPNWQIPAHVRTIIPTADREKATVKVRISFDRLDPKILPDMGVKVAFLEEKRAPQNAEAAARAVIPRKSVRGSGEQAHVFVVREGKAERRAVTLGRAIGDEVEVVAGVNPGDAVIVQGPESLREGQSVHVQRSEE